MSTLPRLLRHALAASVIAMTAAGAAHAEDASAWSNDTRSAIRLVAGNNAAGATSLRAGVEMKLESGWHTYWRYPGDSGVPPRFDFAGSDNLKSAKVLYPAPQLHSDDAGQTIGYEGSVVFPIDVMPQDPGKPVALKLKVDYAVCEKLCVPAEGSAALTLAPGASAEDAAVTAAFARVPKQVPQSAAGLTAKRVSGGAKPLVMVDLPAPAERAGRQSSSRARPRNGPCRSRSRRRARPPAIAISASISTACRRASTRTRARST